MKGSFILCLSLIQLGLCYLFSQGILNYAHFIADYSRRFEIWRYFTVALVHDGAFQLAANVVPQLIYGLYLEYKFGWRKVTVIFWLGTCFGELFANATSTSAFRIGAIGGVTALRMAYVASWILKPQWNQSIFVAFTLIQVLPLPLLVLDMQQDSPFLPLEFYAQLLRIMRDSFRHIFLWKSVAALSGGAIAGLLLGFACLTSEKRRHHFREKRKKSSKKLRRDSTNSSRSRTVICVQSVSKVVTATLFIICGVYNF